MPESPMYVQADWPTDEQATAVEATLIEGWSSLERLVFQVEQLTEGYEEEGWRPSPPPTLETVGVLFSLADGITRHGENLTETAERLRTLTDRVNLLRLDAGVYANAS